MKAECIYCKHRLSMNKSGCTTQLGRHAGGCTAKMNKLRETVASVQNFEYNQSKVREAFAHMVIVHELPFNVAEYELFNNFARTLTPHWQKISRFTLKKDCITTFELEKKKLKEELKHVDRISVTTDLWKSDQTVSYMVITRRYVDSNWNLQKRTLNFCDVPPPHTGLIMSDVLHKCFVEWGIEKKVWTITMDNATNNDAAVRLLKENLSYSHNLPLGGDIFHVRCCAHILNILVKYGLSAIEDAISKVRESVKHIIASETRINMFSEIAKQLHLSNKKLVLDCCTRWNATYFMLSAALEFKDVFPRYQLRDSLYKSLPSEEEWKKVSVVCSFLEDFHIATELISGSEYLTANLFLPELVHIKKLLKVDEVVTRVGEETKEPNETFMQEMVKKMKKRFDKYWGSCNLLISMAAALDPRNKMKYIEWCARNVYSEVEGIELKVTVRGKLYSLYNEYVEAYKKTSIVGNSIDDQVESLPSSSGTKGKGKRLRSDYEIYMQSVDSIDEIKSELDLYFEEGVVVWKEETDFDELILCKCYFVPRIGCELIMVSREKLK
ncbi:hypothetical protein C2S52_010909 [Perilla frutescens var. hirtella]|nr:hypothetical protein C2S52_010909 [Perilla frutescens var. hirtella]